MKMLALSLITLVSACGSQDGATPASGPANTTTSETTTEEETIPSAPYPTLNLSGAVALALVESTSLALDEQSSPIQKVTASGELKPIVTSGTLSVQKFMVAPRNKVYVLLNGQQVINEAEDLCILAEIDSNDNSLTCIEKGDNFSVSWDGSTKPIQFDTAGNIYYLGYLDGKTVLRKYSSGSTTDIINDNISISQYIVSGDGSIFLRGSTQSSGASWLRKLTTAGSLQNILTSSVQFLEVFPDGNLYFGLWTSPTFGVKRYNVSQGVLDSTYYMAGNMNGITTTKDIDLSSPEYCGTDSEFSARATNFCGFYGTMVSSFFKTTSGSVYALTGWGAEYNFVKYYPSLEAPEVSVKKVSIGKALINSVVLAGLGADNENKLVLFDTSSGIETDMLKSEDIEVYHVSYNASENAIIFDGLRFSDNKYVIGRYDVESGTMVASPISQKLSAYESL